MLTRSLPVTMSAMTKNMDKSTASQSKTDTALARGFARTLLAGLQSMPPAAPDVKLAQDYWARHFDSPWSEQNAELSALRLARFLETVADMGQQGALLKRWRHLLRADISSDTSYEAFISDFMQALLHHPRGYLDFTCQRQAVQSGHPMDFAIQHPVAVEYWTVYLTSQGLGQLLSQGELHELSPHSVLIMPPGISGTVQRQQNSSRWTFDMLSFRSNAAWLELLDWTLGRSTPALLELETAEAQREVADIIRRLENTGYQQGDLYERLCRNLIEQLLILIGLINKSHHGETQLDPRLREVVHYLLSHYAEPASLADIAGNVHLSGSRLNTLFRQQFGCSVLSWRDNIRLQKARELLSSTSQRMGAIANAVGYDDPLYFSRKFRQRFGQSPSQFRAG